jgi:uncharacterized protein YecE (DUF72 family)
MLLPYILGCPSWSEPAWLGSLYPVGTTSSAFLEHYVRLFNGVEGNTTFYARPSMETVQRWARLMPEGFQFCAKFPRDISHSSDLAAQVTAARQFVALMSPLGRRLGPLWLQLPARFEANQLGALAYFLDELMPLAVPLAVEVRNLAFFERGEAERALNRLLHERGVERICLDSRPLFSCQSRDAAVLHAQSRKPRLPVRPAAFSLRPQVRFIGHPDLLANEPFLMPWVAKVAQWIEEGRTPHVYLHTPDNHQAPGLALHFHARLQERLPGLADLHFPVPEGLQPGLF